MTTTPARVSFKVYLGATFSEQVTLNDSDGNPLNLTGFTARMQAKREPTDAAALLTLDTADGSLVLGGVAGTVALLLDATATGNLIPLLQDPEGETWVYDLLLTNPAATPDIVDRVLQGALSLIPGVTD